MRPSRVLQKFRGPPHTHTRLLRAKSHRCQWSATLSRSALRSEPLSVKCISWPLLGAHLAALGVFLAALGALLGALGPLFTALGPLLVTLGPLLAALELLLAALGPLLKSKYSQKLWQAANCKHNTFAGPAPHPPLGSASRNAMQFSTAFRKLQAAFRHPGMRQTSLHIFDGPPPTHPSRVCFADSMQLSASSEPLFVIPACRQASLHYFCRTCPHSPLPESASRN